MPLFPLQMKINLINSDQFALATYRNQNSGSFVMAAARNVILSFEPDHITGLDLITLFPDGTPALELRIYLQFLQFYLVQIP